MTRILSFVLAGATVFAASRAETTTYVDGNVAGIAPNTGGTLVFSDDKAMVFRTGLTTVSVPYASVSRSELGVTRETSHGAPLYKVWARRKKTETQYLTVDFKNEEGEAKTMTLELAQASAPSVLAAIQDHTGKTVVASAGPGKSASTPATVASGKPIIDRHDKGAVASPPTKGGSDWWGDDIWKTKRNADMWTKPTGAVAPEE